MINPGEVYTATLNGAGQRPIVVISREELNRGHYCPVQLSGNRWNVAVGNAL